MQRTQRFAGADRIWLGVAPGLQWRELQERRRLRRNGAKAQHGAAAIAMLVELVLVGVTHRRRSRHYGIAVTVLMPIMAMLMVVGVLMLLCVLMGLTALVSTLSQHFGEAGRKRDGQGRGQ